MDSNSIESVTCTSLVGLHTSLVHLLHDPNDHTCYSLESGMHEECCFCIMSESDIGGWRCNNSDAESGTPWHMEQHWMQKSIRPTLVQQQTCT